MSPSLTPPAPVRTYIEIGGKRVFASALDWPGWSRGAKTEPLALEALAAYAPRYAAAIGSSGLTVADLDTVTYEVIERVTGSASTDFGVPGLPATADAAPVGTAAAERLADIVRAAWTTFDAIVSTAPAELRKGPRGGGRDRDRIVDHVLDAEGAYLRKLGLHSPPPSRGDAPAIEAHRKAILAVLGRPTDGSPVAPSGWLLPYAARRLAWHVLDHGWEVEDRTD
jgi:hypothetical protein